jgi:hypothetical protein
MNIYKDKLISSPFNYRGLYFYTTLYGRFVKLNTGKHLYTLMLKRKQPITHDKPDSLVFDIDDTGEITITFE